MNRYALAVLAGAVLFPSAQLAAQEEPKLPVQKVILYKDGIGYFERRGKVEGNVALRFKARDMSDLLMTLTVLDLTGGAVRTIDYESTKTVDQQLSEYRFDLREAKGLPAILEQMKGSEMSVTAAGNTLSGRLLAIEKRLERRDNAQTEIYRLSLLLAGGMVKNFDLNELSDIRFTDPRLQEDLQRYLTTLFSRIRRDQKQVSILVGGKGERDLLVSYVQEQPVWKATYRLVLAPKQKPLLQAWAIVDNVSEEDWKDVSLTLVSGLPVSFVQDLYNPWYVQRPTVSVQREGGIGPVTYEAGEALRDEDRREAAKSELQNRARGAMLGRSAAPMSAAGAMPPAPPSIDKLKYMAQQATQVVAASAGALFRYDIQQPVTVQRDHSALLPIANTAIDAQRVSIYNEATRAENPMDGVRLKNSTGLTLEGGAITVLEENAFAGEALMDTLKADDQRYISFAVDLGTRVNTKSDTGSQEIVNLRVVRGVMELSTRQQEYKTYTITNIEPKEKTVIVEHPLRSGWNLVGKPEPIDKTPQHYRFAVTVKARETVPFKVTEERPGRTTIVLTDQSRDQILIYAQQKTTPDDVRKFLEKVADLQGQIADLRAQSADLERQRTDIGNSQSRVRENLKALGQTEAEKALRNRYVADLDTQETKFQELSKGIDGLKARIQDLQKQLSQMLAEFKFEPKT